MKSKIHNNILVLMFAAIASSSCSDSFLDTAPIMSETESSFIGPMNRCSKRLLLVMIR